MTTYTGNGGTKDINVGHKPDFVWIKTRTGSNRSHYLFDSVRGVQKFLQTDATTGESSATATSLTSFNNNGFTTGSRSGMNDNTVNHVTWTWKAGGNKNTFNVDDKGYANASDVNMSVGSIRSAIAVSSGNDYSAGYAGHSPVGSWSWSDSWSGLPAYSSGKKGYFSGTETLSNGSVISAAANPKPFSAVVNGSQGFVLRASTTVTLRLLVQTNVTEIATTSSDSQTFGDRTIVATNPTSGTYVEATGKCFWWSGNSNYPSISIMGTLYDAPAQPTIAATGCSVGTKQGFSIIKHTGSESTGTFSHGLSQAPDFMICKRDSSGPDWGIYHRAAGKDKVLYFTTAAATTSTTAWNDTHPTDSLVHVGNNGTTNGADSMIYYIWHDVPGLQKFGSFIANANADGPYVELGFRPALVVAKKSSGTGTWFVIDSERDSVNPTKKFLEWNDADVEASSQERYDFLSNGFKVKAPSGYTPNETSGDTYIYMAWAEAPTVDLFGGGANAR